jgi:UDP-N-acetylglucosamine 2-epimerase (non-hydrolysing)
VIGVVYGTTGELIKLAPVLTRLEERGMPALTLCTGQQAEQIPALLDDFGLMQPSVWLSRGSGGHDLERPADLPRWCAGVTATFSRRRRELRARWAASGARPLLVVHGDTLTTVLGAAMGHVLRVPVAHIEAGMRSGNWRDPFPEELDRRVAARLARTHFAPDARAAANLRAMKVRGEIVDTGGNTIRDAIELVPPGAIDMELPRESFGLASLHRFELLSSARALNEILGLLREASRSAPILFVDHPVTAAAVAAHDLDSLFDERFRRIPRQRYFDFIALLKASAFLVTDSGGSQQECAHLGHPCLVHRAVTEHSDGLGRSVVLSRMDADVARAFLLEPLAYSSPPMVCEHAPTDVIVEHLERRGHLARVPAGLARRVNGSRFAMVSVPARGREAVSSPSVRRGLGSSLAQASDQAVERDP